MTCCGGCADKAKQVARRVQTARITPTVTHRCCDDPVTREEFVAEARKWIGTPYLHQGRNRYGVDCIGLILVAAWSLELTDYDVTGYGRTPNAGFLQSESDRLMTRIATADVLPGDVYLMRFTTDPQHMAIATDRGLIHAWGGGSKRVVETSMPLSWRSRIVQAYRVPGVA